VTPPRPTIRRIDPPEEPAPAVRPAEQRDIPRIALTLTLAVGNARWTRWALPTDGRTQRLTRLHELAAGHRGVETGAAWVSDSVASVAAWEPPAAAPGTQPVPRDVAAALARELPNLHAERWPVVAATAERVAAARPAEPHWWLAHLGTRPTARRAGSGGAVLGPALEICDATGTTAAAAVYTWAGARFLRRFGFEVTAALRTTDDELPIWVLSRSAGAAA
jgi:GNAT superfamily N-acetyltransferase